MDPAPRIQREQALRIAVLRGDDSAWRVLYDSAFQPLYRFVYARARRNETLTEEVIQDCWMTAVRKIRSFDPKAGSFESWMTGIAHNMLRNNQRAETRRRTTTEVELELILDPVSDTPGLEITEQIGLALTELPARYQSVLRARYTEQQTVAEIATATNQSLKTIESLLSRARSAFRQAFARFDREPPDEIRT